MDLELPQTDGDKIPLIGRIHENEGKMPGIPMEAVEAGGDVPTDHPSSGFETAKRQIARNHGDGGAIVVDEDRRCGRTAQGLDTAGSGAGKKIKHDGVRHPLGDDIKNRFAQSIGRRADRGALG